MIEGLETRSTPATITVNGLDDPGVIGDAELTLREGLLVVNSGTESGHGLSAQELAQIDTTQPVGTNDIIQFDVTGTITLGGATEFDITRSVIIDGPGASQLTIDGLNSSRVFDVDNNDTGTTIDVQLRGLTITGGGDGTEDGGNVHNQENLTILSSTITGGSASFGGGIFNSDYGALTVGGSTISANSASTDGGGVHNAGTADIGTSTISGNTATENGGAIRNRGELDITSSTITGNTAAGLDGGAIETSSGVLNITDTTISGNTAGDDGGALYGTSSGTITITGSTISDNSAVVNGGGIRQSGSLSITNSTISGNSADQGGGLRLSGSAGKIFTNTTISGNSATGDGGGIYLNATASATITSSTITGNHARSDDTGADYGGGVFQSSGSGTLTLYNSIVAGNYLGSGTSTFDDINGDVASESLSNLIGVDTGLTGINNGTNGNQIGTDASPIDPLLGPLQDNGGATFTHALLDGSPAINAGNNGAATGLEFDQRGSGFPRIVGGLVDIGAYESSVLPPLGVALASSTNFTVIGATGSPTNILSVKIFDGSGNQVSTVQPFNFLSSLRVATGDFDGDGRGDEFAVLGRRTGIDFRAEIVTYDLDSDGNASETGRFFAFDDGILGNGFITAGDFDGDGDDDLAVAQIGGARNVVTLQIHTSNGDGTFVKGGSTTIDFGVVSAPRIGAGDTDGDGQDEIVVAARTPAGARVLVLDADTGTSVQKGAGFTWTFGIDGYSRGAFVAVGEFDPNFAGAEIVLGSNVGGGGRVDIVSFDGNSDATLVDNGRLSPFGDGYNAAVRVSVGQLDDRTVLVAGQDRFQAGQYTILAREVNTGETNPEFEVIDPITALTLDDGLAPPTSPDGNRTLGPFMAFANLTSVNVTSLLAPSVPGADLLDGDPDDIDLALAVFDERTQVDQDELDELFALA